MFVSPHNLVLAAVAVASGVSALAPTPVVNRATVPKLNLSPLESKIICLKGEIALAILTKVNYQSSAYAFCSSFISIPPVTSSVTTTETSFTPTTTTVPFTATVTQTLPDVTVTTTVTAGAAAKRAVAAPTPPAPPFISAIKSIKSDLISAGCSCIRTKIPLATTTTTLTETTTQASPTITAFSTVFTTTMTQSTTTVTQTLPGAPDTSCNGAVCGAFRQCSATGQGCSCYTSAEGPGFCARDSSCSGPARCTRSSDCGGSQVCIVNSCCGAQGICLNLQCNNPARMLMKARRQNGERTSRNDGSNTLGGVVA